MADDRVIAALYLTAFLHSRRRVVFGLLFSVGAVALAVATGVVAEEGWRWNYYGYGHDWGFVPMSLRLWVYAILLLALAFAWRMDKKSVLPTVAVAGDGVCAAVAAYGDGSGRPPYVWTHSEPMVAMYALVAAVCVFLAWWGVREGSKAIVNYGIAAFALTVMWFYLGHHGQAGPVAGTDCAGRAVPRGRMGAGEDSASWLDILRRWRHERDSARGGIAGGAAGWR